MLDTRVRILAGLSAVVTVGGLALTSVSAAAVTPAPAATAVGAPAAGSFVAVKAARIGDVKVAGKGAVSFAALGRARRSGHRCGRGCPQADRVQARCRWLAGGLPERQAASGRAVRVLRCGP